MCKMVGLDINGRTVNVASIKSDYVKNIVDSISLCHLIDKVVLFGSALEDRCTEESDIDIAVFGKESKSKMFKNKSYRDYINSVVSYGEIQDYDILYFDTNKKNDYSIMQDINNGEILFERQ
ncbi:MAG: nucleotidyltransferase domain-containing protein [Lachnospiraceae bacterium]|nr:nucleotidyltransferase domain-containing protein [Lachnospiraceae bacterium]